MKTRMRVTDDMCDSGSSDVFASFPAGSVRGSVVTGICGVMMSAVLPFAGMSPAVAATVPVSQLPAPVNADAKPAEPAMVKGGQVLRVPTGLPNSVVGATFTAVSGAGGGYLSVYSCDKARPATSVVNYGPHDISSNYVLTATSKTGEMCVYTNQDTHVVVDLSENPIPSPTMMPTPKRMLDTRTKGGKVRAGGVVKVQTGKPGQRVYGNVTVTEPSAAGYATVYTNGTARPNTSTINYTTGNTVANFVSVVADSEGYITLYSSQSTHLIFDQVGAAIAETPILVPKRMLDTRNNGGTRTAGGTVIRVKAGPPNTQVWGNLTLTDTAAAGYAVVYTTNTAPPPIPGTMVDPPPAGSSISVRRAGDTRAAYVTAVTNNEGYISIYTSQASHLIFDRYTTGPAPTPRTVAGYPEKYTPALERIYDTREAGGGTFVNVGPYMWDGQGLVTDFESLGYSLDKQQAIPRVTVEGTTPATTLHPANEVSPSNTKFSTVYTATFFPTAPTGRPLSQMYLTGKTPPAKTWTGTKMGTVSFVARSASTDGNVVAGEVNGKMVYSNLTTGKEHTVPLPDGKVSKEIEVSPDGTKIVFTGHIYNPYQIQCFVYDVPTSTLTQFGAQQNGWCAIPLFIENGKKVVAEATSQDGRDSVVVLDPYNPSSPGTPIFEQPIKNTFNVVWLTVPDRTRSEVFLTWYFYGKEDSLTHITSVSPTAPPTEMYKTGSRVNIVRKDTVMVENPNTCTDKAKPEPDFSLVSLTNPNATRIGKGGAILNLSPGQSCNELKIQTESKRVLSKPTLASDGTTVLWGDSYSTTVPVAMGLSNATYGKTAATWNGTATPQLVTLVSHTPSPTGKTYIYQHLSTTGGGNEIIRTSDTLLQ